MMEVVIDITKIQHMAMIDKNQIIVRVETSIVIIQNQDIEIAFCFY